MLRRCPGVQRLLDDWVSQLQRVGGTDEAALESVWSQSAAGTAYHASVTTLPISYHALPVKRSYAPGSVIGMGLSMDVTKLAMKRRVTKQPER